MAENWRIYDTDTVAYKLDKSELPGWVRKRVVVDPGEGAIIIRDGVPQDLLTEAKQQIQGVVAGVVDKLFGWITGRANVQIVMVDLAPIRIPIYLGAANKRGEAASKAAMPDGSVQSSRSADVAILAVTADRETVSAEVLLTVKLHEPEAGVFAGLLKDRRALSRWDLASMLRDEFVAAVLVPEIAARSSADLRGNRELAQSLAEQAHRRLEAPLRAKGLFLMSFAINWGLSESEKVQIEIRRGEEQEKATSFAHQRRLAEIRRDLELQRTRIDNLHELKRAEAAGDESLKDLLLAGEIRREGMLDGKRVAIAKVDAEVRTIRLEVEKKEAELRLETRRSEEMLRLDVDDREWRQNNQRRLAEIEAEDKEMASMVRMQIQMATAKHEREMAARRMELDADFRRQQADIESRFSERKIRLEEDLTRMSQIKDVLTAGLSSGAVSPDVLNTFLAESTKQCYGTASDDKAAALFDSEQSKSNLQTYQQAEDRERQQQRDMTRLSTNMMAASKQTYGPSVVLGVASPPPAAPNPPQPEPVANDAATRLARLKSLHEQGLIDDDEYKSRKAKILEEV